MQYKKIIIMQQLIMPRLSLFIIGTVSGIYQICNKSECYIKERYVCVLNRVSLWPKYSRNIPTVIAIFLQIVWFMNEKIYIYILPNKLKKMESKTELMDETPIKKKINLFLCRYMFYR